MSENLEGKFAEEKGLEGDDIQSLRNWGLEKFSQFNSSGSEQTERDPNFKNAVLQFLEDRNYI